jgi:hypothetical protein
MNREWLIRTGKVILILAAMGAICLGCSPGVPSAPSAPKQPVTGAFGFRLGEILDAKYPLNTNEDGRIWAMVDLAEDQRPFRSASIDVTGDRRIYCINAQTERVDDPDRRALQKTLIASLRGKYGAKNEEQPSKSDADDEVTLFFGGLDRDVMLRGRREWLSVIYTDINISESIRKKLEAADQARRGKVAKGL